MTRTIEVQCGSYIMHQHQVFKFPTYPNGLSAMRVTVFDSSLWFLIMSRRKFLPDDSESSRTASRSLDSKKLSRLRCPNRVIRSSGSNPYGSWSLSWPIDTIWCAMEFKVTSVILAKAGAASGKLSRFWSKEDGKRFSMSAVTFLYSERKPTN